MKKLFQGGQASFVQLFPRQFRIGEMPVMRRLAVDGLQQVELFHHVRGLEGENAFQRTFNGFFLHLSGAEGIHPDGNGSGVADGVGHLQFTLVRQPGGYDVLGDPAAHVCRGTVHLGRVLPGEGATAVPGIDGQNAGETLLGVPREVFERSAFIGQNALAVDQDAELERRIAALITTGEEDTSYTESYDRLKKQLNRRRHNKTGLIPALERETDQLRAALAELDALNDQAQQSRRELDALERRAADLRQQTAQWQALAAQEQADACQQAAQAALTAQARADTLAADCAALPDDSSLTLLEGQAAALPGELSTLTEKRSAAEEAAQTAQQARNALEQHPLYPAAEPELRQRSSPSWRP